MWGKCVPGGARSKCKGPEAESSVASWRNWGRARVRGSPDRLEGLLGPTTAGLRGLGSRCHLLQILKLGYPISPEWKLDLCSGRAILLGLAAS